MNPSGKAGVRELAAEFGSEDRTMVVVNYWLRLRLPDSWAGLSALVRRSPWRAPLRLFSPWNQGPPDQLALPWLPRPGRAGGFAGTHWR